MTVTREAELIAEVAVWRDRARLEADRADRLSQLIREFGDAGEKIERAYDATPAGRIGCEDLDCGAKMWREEAHIAGEGETETAWCDDCWNADPDAYEAGRP